MTTLRNLLRGAAIAVMAEAVGLKFFSGDWWAFMVAGAVLSTLRATR